MAWEKISSSGDGIKESCVSLYKYDSKNPIYKMTAVQGKSVAAGYGTTISEAVVDTYKYIRDHNPRNPGNWL